MESTEHSNGAKESDHAIIYHPLGPLTGPEFAQSAAILQASCPGNPSLHFKSMVLLEPPRAELLAYLDAERRGQSPAPLVRRVYVAYYIRNTVSNLYCDQAIP
jgi:primary-amine oxidase